MTEAVIARDERRRNFHTLDGLRGVAAAAVIGLHNEPLLTPIPIHSGYLAVDLFFLMSGFVIAAAYDHRFDAGMGAPAFLRLRAVRLYPLYILSVAVSACATVFSVGGFRLADWSRLRLLQAIIGAVLLVPVPWVRGALLFPLNPMAWSLFVEMIFNIAHAGCFRALRGRRLWGVVAGCGTALLVSAAWMGTVDFGVTWPTCWVAIPRAGFSFFLGVGLLRLHRQGRLPHPRVPAAVLLVLVLAVLMIGPDRAHRFPYDGAVVFLVFPAILCAAIANEPRRPRLFTILGEASYPAYILQAACLAIIAHVYARLSFQPFDWRPWSALLTIALVMIAGWVAGVMFDPWARRALGARLPRVGTTPASRAQGPDPTPLAP